MKSLQGPLSLGQNLNKKTNTGYGVDSRRGHGSREEAGGVRVGD